MKILTFTTLFPNSRNPTNGIFVRTRLQRLLEHSPEIQAQVLAPVAWYPRGVPGPERYTRLATVARHERQDGLDVWHPRYLVIPKIGMTLAPATLSHTALAAARRLIAKGYDFDLIDSHYFYPDGVAAARMAQALDKPFTVTARGTDINLIPRYPKPRRQILEAAAAADRIFTVCAALRDELIELGAAADKIFVARNGVDLDRFRPAADREALRQRLGMNEPSLLSVGHLVERKGHNFCIEAIAALPDFRLYIIGGGVERARLEALASELGVAARVTFVGRLDQAQLRNYYAAADALLLASDREGWANVLLESMACGTPVVATAIWGTPEVVATPQAGELVEQRTGAAIAAAVRRLFQRGIDRHATRAYAERFSWDETSALQQREFASILEARSRP